MKRLLSLLLVFTMIFSLSACAVTPISENPNDGQSEQGVLITDMGGRKVLVPEDTKNSTVASTYGVATPFFVTLRISDRVLACNFKNKGFIRKVDSVIVNTGDIGTTENLDAEALASYAPDVYICKISDGEKLDVAKKLGIPALTLTAEVPEEVMATYEMLGKAFGVEDRAKEITDYIQTQLDEIDKLAATIPEDKKVTALCMGSTLGRVAGDDMLQTIMLKRVGAKTVVDGITGDRFWVDIGTEKVFTLDPECIFITSSNILQYTVEDLKADKTWAGMQAIKTDRVYQIPAKMDSWDMPGPGFVLAMYFMMNSMYPDVLSDEYLQQKIDEYYQTLYGKTFTGEEIGY